ncbi:unnamed protein product [Adineta steineri]|uniref:Uncharacterized protein n=1 Tax=Adineta steineri TaxID=433720 RepID=A0A819QCR1_9BILA|nr:unnamed protein product [Adineta steineri]CAF4027309.1 unnamed protein product [Adineta steineri]
MNTTLQPIVNGISDNLIAIQASQLSTILHQQGLKILHNIRLQNFFLIHTEYFVQQGNIEGKTSYLQTPCLADLRGRQSLFHAIHCIKLVTYSPGK